jgi:D-sedoheptulose 7-phosphate isomerase
MKDRIAKIVKESIMVKQDFFERNGETILAAARQMATCFAAGHKILVFGNGGSAADAQHITGEFVNRFMIERRPLPAISLTTDTSILTAIGNDYSFDEIFLKQVRALGKKGDIAWGISTSGQSKNVLIAMKEAKDLGLFTLGMTGCGGGALGPLCDLSLDVASESTPRIQETHNILGHILCDLVDRILFPDRYKEA